MQDTFWWLQPPLQHKDEPAGHRSQELPYPLSALSVERKYMEIDIESQLSVFSGKTKGKKEDSASQARAGLSLAPVPDPMVQWEYLCSGGH